MAAVNRLKHFAFCYLLTAFFSGCTSDPQLPAEQVRFIADKIYQNECASKEDNLIAWNKGEEFPSLGIGHFIWYPKGVQGPFTESFPALLAFAEEQGVLLPAGLSTDSVAPWNSREQFISELTTPFVSELRNWLKANIDIQASFLVHRFQKAVPRLVGHASPNDQQLLRQRIRQLLAQPKGGYLLIDYINFKGEGINPRERYNGKGWGLLQVLQQMDDRPDLLNAFADSAAFVLKRRIENSPPERGEKRWLAGWINRINTYRPS